jgi:hypothetical protein
LDFSALGVMLELLLVSQCLGKHARLRAERIGVAPREREIGIKLARSGLHQVDVTGWLCPISRLPAEPT